MGQEKPGRPANTRGMEKLVTPPDSASASLQDRLLQLEQQNSQLAQQNAELAARLKWYEEQLRLSLQKKYGASSERTHPGQLQLELFNEAEAVADPRREEPSLETITYRRQKGRKRREDVLAGLPEEVIVYDLPEAEQVCPCCGEALHHMSDEVREELKLIPAQAKAVKHVRRVYACRQCEREGTETPIITAPMPAPAAPGSLASPSALAHIMTQKYVDALPLYRQEQQLARLGLDLSRQTMANWMLNASEQWLQPLYDRLHMHLLTRRVLHADETTLQVLQEPGRPAQTESYLWLYRTGRDGPAIVLYDYQMTRGGEHPAKFLAGYQGYLQVDGYAGYHRIAGATLVGCWAHARRKFDEALKVLPAGQRAGAAAQTGLTFCNQLFAIERSIPQKAPPEERLQVRTEKSRPVADSFLAWLRAMEPQVLPKSMLGQAVAYCLNQWAKLIVFLQDGRLELDNNRSERSIKPVVIGRKNWLFANTPRGARASATIYSIIETAKANGLNPFAYLTWLFEELPQLGTKPKLEALDRMLPWSESLPQTCRHRTRS